MSFFKRTNWVLVLLVSLLVDIILVFLDLYIYDLKYHTINYIYKNYMDDYLKSTLPFIPFSLVTWEIVRIIKRWIETNEKKQSNSIF